MAISKRSCNGVNWYALDKFIKSLGFNKVMMVKKCAVLFSGGKDSCLALHRVLNPSACLRFEVKYLLSIIPRNFDSFMFHKPYLSLLEKQAEMLDIDLIVMESEGVEEKEVNDLRKLIESVKKEVDMIVVGGIASSYQGNRVKKICDDLGLEFYAPLWESSSPPTQGRGDVWKELLGEGFKVILTKLSCDGFGKEWVGKVIGEKELKELKKLSEKYKFRVDFEGGEAESAVLYMPEFSREIKIKFKVKNEGEYRHWMEGVEVK